MSPSADDVIAEVRAITRLVGLADPGGRLDALRPHIERYAELAVAPDTVELVVGGDAAELARTAESLGAGASAVAAFLDCVDCFHPAIVGLKVSFAGESPSLYARMLAPKADGLAFLARHVPTDALAERMAGDQVLYGLGFCGDPCVFKTYTLAGHGFVSWRLDRRGITGEHKEYRADAVVEPADGRWGRIVAGLVDLGFGVAGHASDRVEGGERVQPKLYFERIGAIPTDWSAR